MRPLRSAARKAVWETLSLKLLSGGSLGMSTHLPVSSNFQPWYPQRSPSSSLRPKKSEAPLWGQTGDIAATLPLVSRRTRRFSPSSRVR